MAIHEAALSREPGIMLYPGTGCVDGKSGDQVLIAPPYRVTREEVDIIVHATSRAIELVLGNKA
jgi:adenosylmethionine-8-amino-7-oxononanoate aminotransferase